MRTTLVIRRYITALAYYMRTRLQIEMDQGHHFHSELAGKWKTEDDGSSRANVLPPRNDMKLTEYYDDWFDLYIVR